MELQWNGVPILQRSNPFHIHRLLQQKLSKISKHRVNKKNKKKKTLLENQIPVAGDIRNCQKYKDKLIDKKCAN